MTDGVDSAREDLAFLRQLVDEGDWRRPLRFFGATYLAIGVAIFAQVVVQLALTSGPFAMPGPAPLVGVIAVWVAYSVAQTAISFRLGDKSGTGLRSRAGAAGLIAMTLSHLTMLIVFAITAIRLQDVIYMQFAAMVFFALQGGLWITLHALQRQRWQLVIALGWFVATIAAAPLLYTPGFAPAVVVIVSVLMIMPGIYMLCIARRPVQ